MTSYTHKTKILPSHTIAHNWTPTNPNPPRALLFLQHGFGEYAERYTSSHARLILALTERNIDVWALDLEGHGRSPGENGRGIVDVERAVREHVWLCGHVAGIYTGGDGDGIEEAEGTREEPAEDTPSIKASPSGDAQATSKAEHPPIFLFGHSLGGLVTAGSATALLAANHNPTPNSPTANPIPIIITGLILTSPVFPLPGLTPLERFKALTMHLLARPLAYLFPSTQVPWPASPGGTLCGDAEEECRAAEDEVMFHKQISWTVAATAVGVARGIWRGIRRGLWDSTNGDKNADGKDVDVLVLHGRGDCWTDWRGSSWFVEGVRKSRGAAAGTSVPEGEEGSGAKLVILESPYHELLNAGGNEGREVLAQVLEWIEERI
ncbi:Alpha/Beta hydrolase protein [Aspergillus spectabilis]